MTKTNTCPSQHQPEDWPDFCRMTTNVREWRGWPEPGRMAVGECVECDSSITYPIPAGLEIDDECPWCDSCGELPAGAATVWFDDESFCLSCTEGLCDEDLALPTAEEMATLKREEYLRAAGDGMSEKLFAVVFPHQQDEISARCWGEACGKGHVGTIDIGPFMAVGCSETDCPFEEKVSECIGELEHTGEQLYVRKLHNLEAA